MGQGLSARVDVTRLSVDALMHLTRTLHQITDVYEAAVDRHFLRGDRDRTLFRLYARERNDIERLQVRLSHEINKRIGVQR